MALNVGSGKKKTKNTTSSTVAGAALGALSGIGNAAKETNATTSKYGYGQPKDKNTGLATPNAPTAPTTTTQKTTTTPTKTTTTTKTTTPAATKAAASAPTLSLPNLYELPSVDSYGTRPELGTLPGLYELPSVDSYGTRPAYQQSAAVQNAYNTYQQYLASKPGAYESNYQTQIDSLLGEIMNRPAFSYDFNADPMYQMYRDNYIDQGRQAMIDATANAAALTGGYGNSYAATAGQQAYQGHLQQLNNVIPELWQMAYNVYLNEGDDMRANMSLLQSLENTDYNRYRDTVSDWQTDRAFSYNVYDNEYNRDYSMYRDSVADWESDRAFNYNADMDRYNASLAERDFAYQQYRDSVGDWEADRAFGYGSDLDRYNASVDERNFAYQQYLDQLDQQRYEQEWAYNVAQDALAQAVRSSGGSSGGGSGGSSSKKTNSSDPTDALQYSGATGGMIGNKSTDELEELALRMWSGAGSNRDPYTILSNNTSLTAAQKDYVRGALDDLNENDINVGYYRG